MQCLKCTSQPVSFPPCLGDTVNQLISGWWQCVLLLRADRRPVTSCRRWWEMRRQAAAALPPASLFPPPLHPPPVYRLPPPASLLLHPCSLLPVSRLTSPCTLLPPLSFPCRCDQLIDSWSPNTVIRSWPGVWRQFHENEVSLVSRSSSHTYT